MCKHNSTEYPRSILTGFRSNPISNCRVVIPHGIAVAKRERVGMHQQPFIADKLTPECRKNTSEWAKCLMLLIVNSAKILSPTGAKEQFVNHMYNYVSMSSI